MPAYIDGSIMKVGDTFRSLRADSNFHWIITQITATRVYWENTEDNSIDGFTPSNGLEEFWVLVCRADGQKEIKRSGFSKFIRKIENKGTTNE